MTIVYVSDDNYACLLGISLTSLYENNKNELDLNVFIIDDGISQENKLKIDRTAQKYNRKIKFFKVDNSANFCKKMGKWPKNIFYRFLFESVFKDNLQENRVMYLDCDAIIADSIRDLWNVDMEGKACAAVYECMSKQHKKKCCLSDKMPYFNSGVILMDVNKWRELRIEEKVRQILFDNSNTRMEYPDEGIFNYLLMGNIKPLDPRYNLTTIKCVFSYKELKTYRKSRFMYSESEYYKAKNNPCIIHYTNNFLVRRPWQLGVRYGHPMAKYFEKYKECSEWKNIEFQSENTGGLKLAARKIYACNGMLCMIIAGVIYSYIKPLKYDKFII